MLTASNPVAEPLGLYIRRPEGNIYLDVQIFVGIMYISGSLCLWALRAWKIGELEKLALEKEERRRSGLSERGLGCQLSESVLPGKSSLFRRLTMLKRV